MGAMPFGPYPRSRRRASRARPAPTESGAGDRPREAGWTHEDRPPRGRPRLRRHGWPSPRHVHDLLLESWANLADARMIEEFSVGKPNLPGLRIMRGHRRPRPSSSSSQSAGKMILRVSRRHSHLRTAMRASAKKRSVNELVEKCTRSRVISVSEVSNCRPRMAHPCRQQSDLGF